MRRVREVYTNILRTYVETLLNKVDVAASTLTNELHQARLIANTYLVVRSLHRDQLGWPL